MSRAFLVILFCLAYSSPAVTACAALDTGDKPVPIAQEAAIIVWDSVHHRQHFIRRASFTTKSRDIGFLVPTPTIPELAETDDVAFRKMQELIEPEKIEKIKRVWRVAFFGFGRMPVHTFNAASGSLDEASSGVTMIVQQHVAGYDAVVLEARDTAGLGRWLKRHGYMSSPALLKWLDRYVQKRWKITAFKIPKADRDSNVISSTAVRMSFDTPHPFFPYSEPQKPKMEFEGNRRLQVFLFAPQRMAGFMDEEFEKSWQGGRVTWADSLSIAKQTGLAKPLALPASNFQSPQWLTVFDDSSSPRLGTDDVFFTTDTNQERKLPTPIVVDRMQVVVLPLDLILIAVGLFCGAAILLRSMLKS